MALKHSIYDSDSHFTVDPITRALTNESCKKTQLIQNDHNSERFTFELPRYIEGHDMSMCNVVQVHYLNIDAQTKAQNPGLYEVDDMQLSPDDEQVVICSWLISQNATKYMGNLNFVLRFSCVDEESRIQYAWHTAPYTNISVSNGIYNGEMVVEEYVDILEQWRVSLDQTVKDAVADALAQAKESGEFDGPQGPQGVPGKDGTVSFDELTPEQKASLKGEPGTEVPRDTLASFAPLKELKEAQRNLQDAFSVKKLESFDSNVAVIKGGTRAEVYEIATNNLLIHDYENGNGNFTNHLNPLPAGEYVFYAYSAATSGSIKFTITYRRNRTKDDPTDLDNIVVVAGGSVAYNTAYHFSAPDGIDYITTEKTTEDGVQVVLVRAEDFTEIKNTSLAHMYTENLMPLPYQCDFSKSNVEKFVRDLPVIDTLKFEPDTAGGIKVTRADSSIKYTTKPISFYFHYGTEMQLPPGTYTIGCKIYNSVGNLWAGTKAYCRFLVRWEDGDSESYYEETINNGNKYSMRPVSNDKPITFNAFNGIGSILGCVYVQGDVSDWPANGLTFKPFLFKGDTEIIESTSTLRPTVYRYARNFLRPATPRIYTDDGIGQEGTTANGITITKLGGGYYSLNGTAEKAVVFQLGIGRKIELRARSKLALGGVPATAPAGVRIELEHTVPGDTSWSIAQATPGVPAFFDNGIMRYCVPTVHIEAGTVCDNVIIAPQLSPDNVDTFERFKMPVAVTGPNPAVFEYYKTANAVYVGNLSYKLVVKTWKPKN